jgi:SAM-dependent methyltransferase
MPAAEYDKQFFDVIDRDSVSSANAVVPLLTEFMVFPRVIDVGCGRGGWLKVCLEHGATSVKGLDGTYVDRATLLIPSDSFQAMDLRDVSSISGTYDLALCLEVAEHLPRRVARPLVQKLCELAPIVLFSAAIPGQGGTQHINEQWPHYWEQLFRKNGYVMLDPFRLRIAGDRRVALHFKQNLFLYVDRSRVNDNEWFRRELERTQSQDVTVLAANRLTPLYSVTGTWREFWRTFERSCRNRLGL